METNTTLNQAPRRKLSTTAYVVIGLGAFALTIALLYLQENFRGQRAWEGFRRQYEAKGRSLDWKNLIPPPVPDDQNIFKAPGIGSLVKGEGTSPVIEGINQMNAQARKFVVKDFLVAKIHVLAPNDSLPANAKLVRSVDEAATAVNSRSRALAGSSGITLVTGATLAAPPLELALHGQTNSVLKALQDKVIAFAVRGTNGNPLAIYLDSGIPAEEYIKAYESQKTYFDQLAAALQRPYARMDGEYLNPVFIPIQNFVALRTTAQTLGQVAQSYILLNQPREALQALTLLHDSERFITAEPARRALSLVAAMINVATKGVYTATIADGQRLGVWGEFEMATLQKQIEQIDLLPFVRQSFEGELIGVTTASQVMPISDMFQMSEAKDDHKSFKRYLYDLIPKGWIQQNLVCYGRLMEEQIAAFSVGAPGVRPSAIAAQAKNLGAKLERFSPYIYLSRMAIPNFIKALHTAAKNQTLLQLANISLALERYHLATGKYPATLELLCPAYLAAIPRDLITGAPPRYVPKENGKYLLYSVGWNEKDDGGVDGQNFGEGDWVWNPKASR